MTTFRIQKAKHRGAMEMVNRGNTLYKSTDMKNETIAVGNKASTTKKGKQYTQKTTKNTNKTPHIFYYSFPLFPTHFHQPI